MMRKIVWLLLGALLVAGCATELRIKARELGMRTLREDGLRKVIGGMTTLEEVFRVTMGDED